MSADLSVLVVGGEPGAALRTLAEGWTAAGLLRESVWVRAEDVVTGDGPARAPARLVGPGDDARDADLLELVGAARRDLVRVVAVQQVTRGWSPPAAFLGRARVVADLLEAAVPLPPRGTRVHRVNLLVGESGATGLRTEHLLPGWDVTGVVAAEDRPDLDRASVFVREPGNFTGHGLAAVAAVAALWAGVPGGALDEGDATTADGDLVVLRASVRAILGPDAVEEVVRDTVELVSGPDGAAAVLPWARPAADPAAASTRAARFLLGRGDLLPAAWPTLPEPQRRVRGLRAAVVDAVRFDVRMVRVGAEWLGRALRRAVENVATLVLVGRDSDTLVRTRPRRDDSLFDVTRLLTETERVGPARAGPTAEDAVAPRPQTWQDLRRVCFALADGGELPAGLAAPERAGVRELLPPWALAPGPASGRRATRDGGRGEADGAAAQAQARAPAPEEEPAAAAETSAQPADAVDAPGGAVDGSSEGAPAGASAAEPLTAQLVDAVDEQARALDVLADQSGLPRSDVSERAERRLKRRWVVAVVAFVLAAVLTAVYAVGAPSAEGIARAVTMTVLLPLGFVLLANHAYYRSVRRREWKVAREAEERGWRAESGSVVRRERARLELLREALLDWCEVVSWLLHRPWAPLDVPPVRLPEDVLSTLPAAVALGVGRAVDDQARHDAARAAAAVLCRPGWVTESFDALVAHLGEGSDLRTDGYLAADLDVRGGPPGQRGRLLETVRSGAAATLATAAAVADVRRAVEEGRLRLPERRVDRLGRLGPPGQPVSESEFLRTMVQEPTPFALDQWSPRGLQRARHLPTTALVWLPGTGTEPSGSVSAVTATGARPTVRWATGQVALRVDISRRAEPGDLLLFAPVPTAQARERAPETTARPDLVEW
ncbi:hypothetical protein [Georgenia sp. AZ-5]|uniref:hypothetical protein n=1 Tax=Georgenia sp. AZ-5 TaxID=3367526 RepID=UPI00375483EB